MSLMRSDEAVDDDGAAGVQVPGGGSGVTSALPRSGTHSPGGGSGAHSAPIREDEDGDEMDEEVVGVHLPGGGRGVKIVVRLGGELAQFTVLVWTSFCIVMFIGKGPVADGVCNEEDGAVAVDSGVKTGAPLAVEAVDGGGAGEEGSSDSSGPVPHGQRTADQGVLSLADDRSGWWQCGPWPRTRCHRPG